MKTQEYQGLVLLTPSDPGHFVTNGKSISTRLYVKPEDVAKWKEITKAQRDEMMPKRNPREHAQ